MKPYTPRWFARIGNDFHIYFGDSISEIFKHYLKFHRILPAGTRCYFFQQYKYTRKNERWIIPKVDIAYNRGFIVDGKKYKKFPINHCVVIPIYD